ncbi:hypothetical protein BU25DRAFT_422037 [Macroventuria anomochaeta]|uniref:Uncharacterized protein n=1 Tax=Macroventuria anomochaeta TaxID=301207 RepID=A0ACB6S1Z2_9PLEO|nr:uncharacterized protein BU25DRAFT_422037 [Macroventuria anomochaeta]KAF2627157.1 hypothetical protein BU25DRAFT_422037 [Macroventuria anomochaeta]
MLLNFQYAKTTGQREDSGASPVTLEPSANTESLPATRTTLTRPKRTKIYDVAKSVLEKHFRQNPHPTPKHTPVEPNSGISAADLEALSHVSAAGSKSSTETWLESSEYPHPLPVIASPSAGSGSSQQSKHNRRSVDSRGSRRGRRQWKSYFRRSRNASASRKVETLLGDFSVSAVGYYAYTWPECESSFVTRYEWARHEEAIHYCPYRWRNTSPPA